ncbi:MAG TPA: molybdenum cofactor guanylyltransferase [Thiotrichaceae bacterium]|jgi:molybdenum cofactor guanylyltransferase|nr:molybdenum cofactor guanylyltransferase [Thiotrichaceae bacterium]HIM06978.1 molybdenum cofactor guanylyltransferase [Gammaproteobacteria bacterium]
MPNISSNDITGVILAGGQARRMQGQDKGLVLLNNKPMIEYVIDILNPQVATLLINANRNHKKYSEYGFDIVSDELSGYCGPLAGMASALNNTNTSYMITAPCDSPFIPDDLVQRLTTALASEEADISVAHNGERLQPVFCLMKKDLMSSMNEFLSNDERKIDKWFNQHKLAIADFSDIPQTFDNLNTFEDIKVIEAAND